MFRPHPAIFLLVAACTRPDTLLRVDVSGIAPGVDTFQLRIGSATAQDTALPALDVDVPDELAGRSDTFELWALAAGTQRAYARATVTPALHATVDLEVSLAAIDCGPWCVEGDVACAGGGAETCTKAADGCLAWSAPVPSATCTASIGSGGSNGGSGSAMPVPCATDGAPCDDGDPCTQGDTCQGGVCAGDPLCTSAPDNANPTCAGGVCGYACDTGFQNIGSACLAASIVFATSATHGGDFGGLTGADALCQSLAGSAGLTGTFKAWLSDENTAAASRLTHGGPYVLVDGTVLASSWTALTSGSLAHAIDVDEHGSAVAATEVWTNTDTDGSRAGEGLTDDCDFWADAGTILGGDGGETSSDTADWTGNENEEFVCDTLARLYCFQQ